MNELRDLCSVKEEEGDESIPRWFEGTIGVYRFSGSTTKKEN